MTEAQQPTVFDSDQQLLAGVYARALMGVGQKNGSVDQIVDELTAVVSVVNELPKFKATLESPRVPAENKVRMIDSAFGSKVSKDVLNFLKVVANKGRFDCLAAIGATAIKLHDEMAGRVEATLTTASPVEDSVRDQVAKKLSGVLGKTVNLRSVVDPEIIGGMVVRVGDTVYDGSVVNRLQQVRAKAVKRASDAIREQLDRFAQVD
ncbi:MAG: ATP synthase F1 subunit delta [Planctomycetota bacterium]